ncbi:MAG: BBE domain-containing protein [Bacilli bacterium]
MSHFWHNWQQWVRDVDTHFSAITSLYNDAEEGTGIFGRGLYLGGEHEAKLKVSPLFKDVDVSLICTPMTYYEAIKIIGSYYPPYQTFKSAGRFVTEPLENDSINTLLPNLASRPIGSVYVAYTLYSLGGNVANVKPQDSAFFYRDAHYITGFQTVWTEPKDELENLTWFNARWPSLFKVTGGSYVNFPNSETPCSAAAYWGENATRLAQVKQTVDPCNLFRSPQGIRPV